MSHVRSPSEAPDTAAVTAPPITFARLNVGCKAQQNTIGSSCVGHWSVFVRFPIMIFMGHILESWFVIVISCMVAGTRLESTTILFFVSWVGLQKSRLVQVKHVEKLWGWLVSQWTFWENRQSSMAVIAQSTDICDEISIPFHMFWLYCCEWLSRDRHSSECKWPTSPGWKRLWEYLIQLLISWFPSVSILL
jgi:hypothetical protein